PESHPKAVEQPELKIKGHAGYNIYHYQSRYFAVPESCVHFDMEGLRSASFDSIVGHTLSDVKKELDIRTRPQELRKRRVLFIRHSPSIQVEQYVSHFNIEELTVLSIGSCPPPPVPCKVLPYTNREGTRTVDIDLQSVSPELLDLL